MVDFLLGFYNWKPKITWKGKKDGGSYQEFTDRQKRITKYLWNIESRDLLSTICHKRYLQRINCPQNITVDIKCGEDNPHVFLCLYPHGLFDDAEKSMTLQFKVIIPNNCPPIPTKATFILSWEMLAKHENESFTKLESQKQLTQVKFKTGMDYVPRFLLHSQLLRQPFKLLEINVHITTAYSIPSIYLTPDMVQRPGGKRIVLFYCTI